MQTSIRLFLLTILVGFLSVFLVDCRPSSKIENLRIAKIGPFSAVIQWNSPVAASFEMAFGEGTLLDRQLDSTPASTSHRVALTGLKPSTRYSYRIEPVGLTATFRTAPSTDGSFDLMILDADSPACKSKTSEKDPDPDIVVFSGSCAGEVGRKPESVFTVSIPATGGTPIQFGGSLLILGKDLPNALQAQIDPESASLRKIFLLSALPSAVPASLIENAVCAPGGCFFKGKTIASEPDKTSRLEVDTFEVAWILGTGNDRTRRVVIEAPPETKKNCLYCDRLMESGRYEESIAWYKDFIATTPSMSAQEDPYFSMAQILDEKLFRYGEAIDAYRVFLEYYPKSRKRVLAQYRLDYLLLHDDLDFAPLAAFERAKAGLVRNDPIPTVEAVEKILTLYPDATVAPEILFWLGNLLETSHPERSRIHYNTLIQRFPTKENALVAAIALGDILYREKNFRDATVAYEKASQIAPKSYGISILEKLRKSKRNILRENIRWASWIVLAGWLIATLVLRAGPTWKELKAAGILLAAYGFAGGIYFAVNYEKARALILSVSVLAVLMTIVFSWNRALSKTGKKGAWFFVMAHALTCSLAVVYLTMYYFHQVYIFGL